MIVKMISLFSTVALISAAFVIQANNPVHSVLFLIFSFCNVSALLICHSLDFFAFIFLVVYVGAIAVLFLFVVMMLNIKLNELSENLLRYLPIGGLISAIFFLEIFLILYSHFVPFTNSGDLVFANLQEIALTSSQMESGASENLSNLLELAEINNNLQNSFETHNKQWFSLIDQKSNIESLGYLIYTEFFYYYLMASLILLVAMIGAIVLTMNKKDAAKKQLIFKQVDRTFDEAVGFIENQKKIS